ncbi:Uncharacterised protein [Kingella potus]|uniref:Uncharacterized protein n=1 Tax=Kingella potus TaxID=265175 RepID=A0A377R3J9_9NEIS|nr:hypothetical protein [Kingella potus]STR03091.1 Uncharacterised protein [Kingella potus]
MNDDQTQALVTARLLSAARPAAAANVLLAALAAQYGGPGAAIQLVLAAALLYCHIRLAFDRRVFEDFACGRYTPEAFDAALRQTGLRRSFPERTAMPQRSAGALALWRKSLYLTAAQAAVLLIQAV